MRKSVTIIFLSLCLLCSFPGILVFDASACTIAVVSGKGTPDKRPLLWKNRDKDGVEWVNNEVKFFFNDAKQSSLDDNFGYIGIADADGPGHGPTEDTNLWSGTNDHGFAICNSYAYPTNPYFSSQNGPFMKKALMECKSVKDFHDFLIKWDEGHLTANFGVIDAQGRAAIYEVYRYEDGKNTVFLWECFDADDAEHGYIVRANYTQWEGGSTGNDRKQRAEALIEQAYQSGELTHEYLLRHVARDMVDVPVPPSQYDDYNTTNFINRYRTRCCTVVHGVKYPEDPIFTTFWTLLGEPAFAAALPLFSFAHSVPFEVIAPLDQMAPMNSIIENNELRCYDHNYAPYTDIWAWPLYSEVNGHPAIRDYTLAMEDHTFALTRDVLHWLSQIKRYKVPEDFQVYQDFTSNQVYTNYINEEFIPWEYDTYK